MLLKTGNLGLGISAISMGVSLLAIVSLLTAQS